jgi:hypothetical protein
MPYYTGVGSRETPSEIIGLMTVFAMSLAEKGWTLRSGHAPGADLAFEYGCDMRHGAKEIFLPYPGFNKSASDLYAIPPQAYELASAIHPAWPYLKPYVKHFHARNCQQVLGSSLDEPSRFVLCWTKGGQEVGGTRTAIVVARTRQPSIPVFNLAVTRPSLSELLALV